MTKDEQAVEELFDRANHDEFVLRADKEKAEMFLSQNKKNRDRLLKVAKALEVIKNKLVDVFKLYNCKTVEEYNQSQYRDCKLTAEEFESLKEVLGE